MGAALVFPATLATISDVIPADRRGSAVGLWAATAVMGGLLGIVAAGWGVAFVVTAAVIAAAALYVVRCFPATARTPKPAAGSPGAVVAQSE